MSRVKIVVAGDVHIGRVSSRISTSDTADLSARAAFERIVDLALHEQADLVCLTGDVADGSNEFWQALGPLQEGLERLAAAGIMTLAVSGNHDHAAMPRLARQLETDQFRLLGRDGTWERFTFEADGTPLLHIDGWSFPQENARKSPLDTYDLPAAGSIPTLVMVHGDLDVADSPYAPLPSAAMYSKPVTGWLLGHIHAPMTKEPDDRPFILYPGSPQALDPGETGVHGAVVIEFDDGRCSGIRPAPLSTVRYDTLPIDVNGVEDSSEFDTRLRKQVETFIEQAAGEGGDSLQHLALRLEISGQTSIADELEGLGARMREDFSLTRCGVRCTIDGVTLRVLPKIDLDALARQQAPPGMLASVLLELREEKPLSEMSERVRTLARSVEGAIRKQRQATVYSDVIGDRPDDELALRAAISKEVEALLVHLVKEEG